jgi:CubicO group peptidase (beta-lactamase class C family)
MGRTEYAHYPVSTGFEPGTRYKYSDWGYSLLGFVIEKASGKPYEEALKEQIFEPLGMRDTGYDHPEDIMPRRAAGYRTERNQLRNAEYTPMTAPYSAGGLYSSAEDLYVWDQALYSDKVLPAATRAQMFTPVLENYGYGWMIARPGDKVLPWMIPGHLELVHPGSINGFSAEMLRFPDDHVTIIVLANVENVSLGPPLAQRVFEAQ